MTRYGRGQVTRYGRGQGPGREREEFVEDRSSGSRRQPQGRALFTDTTRGYLRRMPHSAGT